MVPGLLAGRSARPAAALLTQTTPLDDLWDSSLLLRSTAMAQASSFIPKHSQPFTLAEAIALEIDTLAAGETQSRNLALLTFV